MSARTHDLRLLGSPMRGPQTDFRLTRQELELLTALAFEPTMADVADALGISTRQTRRRVERMVSRLGVASYRSAIALAAARALIPMPPYEVQSLT